MNKIVFLDDKIFLCAQRCSTGFGGAERYMWLLARAMAAKRWAVVVGVQDCMDYGEKKTIDGVEFIGIGRNNGFVSSFLAWHQFLKTERPSWLCWACASHLLGPLFQMAKLMRIGTIFFAQFDTDVIPKLALSRRSRWWPLFAWGLSSADRIVLQHSEQFLNLSTRWHQKTSILPGIVEKIDEVQAHSNREKYVIWVAQLRQTKRPDILIDIAKKMPGSRFVVCGGPSSHRSPPGYSERIIESLRSTPNINYLGHMEQSKVLDLVGNAALLLCTSDAEGFPSTFLEAWSAGTPVVSLKIDPDNVLKKKGIGRLSNNESRALADIEELMNSPSLRQDMANRGRQHVAVNHGASSVAQLFQNILENQPALKKE